MSNLDLWNLVEKTPPSETKPISGKAYKGTSPKPHYLVHKATETFGPCGIGWGFEIVDEKLLDGALLAPDFFERIHMARVRVWYEWKGKRGVVEHVGQTIFCGKRSGPEGRPFTDEDAPKKSVTDALVKALSMIGFAGDIFTGRYDDSKYVNDLRQEEREARAPEPRQVEPAPEPRQSRPTPPRDEQHGPGLPAQRMAKSIRECQSETDLSALRNQPEFINFWHGAGQVDRRFILDAVTAWKTRHGVMEAAA